MGDSGRLRSIALYVSTFLLSLPTLEAKNMTNPYVSPVSGLPSKASPSGIKNWNRRQWLTAIASGMAIVLLSIVSFVLITQALRFHSESANLPARLQADYASTSRTSWIGGIAAMAGVLLNAGGLVFVRKNKLIVPIALLAVSVLGMIAVAVMFKPS